MKFSFWETAVALSYRRWNAVLSRRSLRSDVCFIWVQINDESSINNSGYLDITRSFCRLRDTDYGVRAAPC